MTLPEALRRARSRTKKKKEKLTFGAATENARKLVRLEGMLEVAKLEREERRAEIKHLEASRVAALARDPRHAPAPILGIESVRERLEQSEKHVQELEGALEIVKTKLGTFAGRQGELDAWEAEFKPKLQSFVEDVRRVIIAGTDELIEIRLRGLALGVDSRHELAELPLGELDMLKDRLRKCIEMPVLQRWLS